MGQGEGERSRAQALGAGGRDGAAQHRPVAQMHAVEIAQGDGGRPGGLRDGNFLP